MSIRDELLEQIVIASGGVVRNPNNRNMLLEDWLLAVDNPIPVGALIYYNFAYSTLSTAITEQVGKVNTAYTERASNINLEQTLSGQVVTYAAGVGAFDRGQNMQVWDGATNLLPKSTPSIAEWFTVGSATITENACPAPDGTNTASILMGLQGAVGDRVFDTASTGLIDGRSFSSSGFIKANSNAGSKITFFTKRSFGGVFSGSSLQVTLTDEWVRLSDLTFTGALDNQDVIVGINNATGDDADSCCLWACQCEEGSSSSPPIYTSGSPASRAPTASSISTFTTPAYWIDSPLDGGGVNVFRVGDLTDGGDFVNGVNQVGNAIALTADGGAEASKYFGLRDLAMVGAKIYSGLGSSLTITGFFAGSSLAVSLDSGNWSDFEYPNNLTFDLTQSAYFTGSLAADSISVLNLRVDAGDTYLLNSTVWIDEPTQDGGANPAYLGNLTNATYNNGVQFTGDAKTPLITFIGDTVDGKYRSAGATANVIGARIKKGSYSIPITSFSSGATWECDLNGTDLDESSLRALIGNDGTSSNPFTIDFTQSDYVTGDAVLNTTSVRDLRISANDTYLSSFDPADYAQLSVALGVPALIPANDFELSFIYKFESNEPTQIMIDNLFMGASSAYSIQKRSTDVFRFLRRNLAGSADAFFDLPVVGDVKGREFEFTLNQTSAPGVTLTAVEIGGAAYSGANSGAGADFTNDVPWNSSLTIGSRTGTSFFADGGISELTVRPI